MTVHQRAVPTVFLLLLRVHRGHRQGLNLSLSIPMETQA
jgi:hypothetical protein